MGDETASPGRRARPSARDARKAQRAMRQPGPAYITRAIPPYELLSTEGLEAVERHADRLLEEIGLEIRGDVQRDLVMVLISPCPRLRVESLHRERRGGSW